ncbi:MAG: leucine-rich repeat domain-containing protein [Verrucomicrobia bacterium]|nr:MAG: leucine-rich repeat domain-containing protein [Verrucomicrobiota bacterium]
MKDDLPTVPARRRWWRVLGWGMLVAAVAICGWSGWRAYDYRAAVREARAAGFFFLESPTPLAAIRADWQAALRLATWTERERRLELPDGTELAPLRPLLMRLDPTDLTAIRCRHVDALRGLTRLRLVDLTGSDVKDLAPLASLAQLQRLDLTNCTGIADLAPLAGLAQLQSIDIVGATGLGAEAVAAFKKSRPRVWLIGPGGRPVNAE